MAVGDTGGGASADKGAVVGSVIDALVGVAIDTGEGQGVGGAGLADGIGYGAIGRINGGGAGIGPCGVVARVALAAAHMSGLDVVPGLNFTGVATQAARFAGREIKGRVILDPVGDTRIRTVIVTAEIVYVTFVTRS